MKIRARFRGWRARALTLARLEGRIAVEELTRRYPGLDLAGAPARRQLLVLRGFESVPVRARLP